MEKQLRYVLSQIAERLDDLGSAWCIFAGAAVDCYLGRPIEREDVEILLAPTPAEQVLDLFPGLQRKALNCIVWPPVELWWGTLPLDTGERMYPFCLDAAMQTRILRRPFLDLSLPVMAPEDLIVLYGIMQQSPEEGRRDLENIQALWQNMHDRLDRDYLQQRARTCRALHRVTTCLAGLGLELEIH